MADRLSRAVAAARRAGCQDVAAELVENLVRDADEAADRWESFHWGEAAKHARRIQVEAPPAVMFELGPLVAVVYEASKGHSLAHWEHEFLNPRPILAHGAGTLWVTGGHYRVTGRGIEG